MKEQETEIFDLISQLIQTLSSPDIAIDDRHTPKLYARFLTGLLSRHRGDGATAGRLHPQPPPSNHSSSMESIQVPASSTAFSPSRMQSGNDLSQGYASSSYSQTINKMDTTPIYRPEATFSAGTGPIHFADLGLSGLGGDGVSEEEMLATMQALENPAWWKNMMMPG